MAQVGNHSTRHLMQILRVIVFALRADRMTFELGDEAEVFFNRLDRFGIDERPEAERAGIGCNVKD